MANFYQTAYNAYVAPWTDYGDSISSVIIEEGVTSIGNTAFGGFRWELIDPDAGAYGYGYLPAYPSLTSITIPVRMTKSGTWAFGT
jgi:hypothetical protein